MKRGKARLLWMAGLMSLSGLGVSGAMARPDPDPAPPAGVAQPPAEAPPAEAPLLPTDHRDWLPPGVDLLIVFALAAWLWMMMSRRRREENLLTAHYYGDRAPVEHGPLRTVTYPSEAYSQELKRYRPQWIEEFRNLQDAWARHDLRPVSGILGPEVRGELERSPGFAGAPSAADDPGLPQIVIDQADPADSWQEGGKEFVTVHFAGRLLEPGAKASDPFDEYWTFMRRKAAETATVGTASDHDPWVVISIRRGNRERSLPRLAHRA